MVFGLLIEEAATLRLDRRDEALSLLRDAAGPRSNLKLPTDDKTVIAALARTPMRASQSHRVCRVCFPAKPRR